MCYSWIGYNASAAQPLILNYDCMEQKIILHEALHTLGLVHQHSSPLRESFIDVHKENAALENRSEFNMYSDSEVTDFGYPYDFGSIMHYGPYFFSNNNLPTITAKPEWQETAKYMGQVVGLSVYDIAKINTMYNCKV